MHRKIDKPYHIDFCFASLNLIKILESVEVGTYEKWTKYSDHKPLIVNFDFSSIGRKMHFETVKKSFKLY